MNSGRAREMCNVTCYKEVDEKTVSSCFAETVVINYPVCTKRMTLSFHIFEESVLNLVIGSATRIMGVFNCITPNK